MTTERKTAIIIGALFLISTTSFLIGDQLIASVIGNAEYLKNSHPNKGQIALGAILQFVNNIALIGIGLMFLPILRKYNSNLAFVYLITRVVEGTLLFVSAISILSIIPLSEQYLKAAKADVAHFETFGVLLKYGWYKAFQLAMIVLSFGSFFLCYLLYKTKLVPRVFSIVGFIGYAALLAKILSEILGLSAGLEILYLPGTLFELLMPLWIMVKGFNISANTSNDH